MLHTFVTGLLPSSGRTTVLADVQVLPPRGLNTSLYLELNRFAARTGWAHGFMHTYALWLGAVLLAAAFVATYAVAWWRRAPRAAALLILGGIGTVVALGVNQRIGHVFEELRPYATHPHALVLVSRANDYSFPSDHAVIAGGLTASVLLVLSGGAWRHVTGKELDRHEGRPAVPRTVKVLAAAAVVLGLFLCFSRVYVGAHYPGDVVAGYLLGSLLVLALSLLRPLAYRVADGAGSTAFGTVLGRPSLPPARVEPAGGADGAGERATVSTRGGT